ncbi:hypothetical protein EW026_g2044 [Hermanssonia centrifuga]|uniref:lytic cellulose monooxygenase (C4-dehydrogenating) n=1 Tax=Hermanssonia centrifuga TaxID=98765 RepID=A0A4S4KPI1_9APHY|nr:hypothetical protein EW026_g2044 [Hermanssonia centrifuga]
MILSVLDVTDPSLACNVGGDAPAGLTAEAAAGSTVTFTMIRWPDDHLGPVDHYMASCEGSCTQFDATNAKWFKLDEDGYDNGVWASTKLIQNNLSASTTIPADLKPGEYLIRHEIIALHSPGQPQFYPACAQVKVTGSGTQSPSSADLVDIPGVYDTTVFPDIWADSFHSFTNPGPPVAFSSSGSNTGSEPVFGRIKLQGTRTNLVGSFCETQSLIKCCLSSFPDKHWQWHMSQSQGQATGNI